MTLLGESIGLVVSPQVIVRGAAIATVSWTTPVSTIVSMLGHSPLSP